MKDNLGQAEIRTESTLVWRGARLTGLSLPLLLGLVLLLWFFIISVLVYFN